ncbi:MAG: DNA polymerase III subunit delta [Erysipelotrichaceae bacterium]|nr:DNA polymerase III subunit delta [Erysipelotrichaceae bacterium]
MIYVISGKEELFIRDKIDEICTDDADIAKMNGSEKSFSLMEMLEYCNASSLFASKNIVLVKDPVFLCRKYDEKETEKLMDYISNPIYETDLVFYTFENRFNEKLGVYKQVCKNAQVIKCDGVDARNYEAYAMKTINERKLSIDRDSMRYLVSVCGNNASLLNKNLDILSLYPESISRKVIDSLCTIQESESAYDFINAYIDRNYSRAIELLRQYLKDEDSVLAVIGTLAAQLRFMYQFIYYDKKGYKTYDIASVLKCTPYRANKTKEMIHKISADEIMRLLNDLSAVELQCKYDSSVLNSSLLEMFILKNMKGKSYAGH